LAKVENGKLVNLQGEMLTYPKNDEVVDMYELLQDFVDPNGLTDEIVDSLQEGHIVRLASGEVVSLKKTANGYWNLEEFQEGHLCRIQNDKFFTLNKDQLIKFERGNIVRIRNENLGELSPVENKDLDSNEQILKIQSDQLAILQNGKFVKSNTLEELAAQPVVIDGNISITWRFPLDYLYIREETPLSDRQQSVALAPSETPIGELFTFFDCTDYIEPDAHNNLIGVLSHAKRKKSLGIGDYFSLTKDYFSGRIDTHGGYFNNYDASNPSKPDAAASKFVIYGLACVGFEKLLDELSEQNIFKQDQDLTALYTQTLTDLADQCPHSSGEQRRRIALTHVLSSICQRKQIQVLLSRKCYEENILGLKGKQ
jgi:hypothetical protein